ncbi:MAG: fibronectin type III domain-containing protein, partial [Myxococcota bacterium]
IEGGLSVDPDPGLILPPTGTPDPPTALVATVIYKADPGSIIKPRVLISWSPPDDPRVRSFRVEVKDGPDDAWRLAGTTDTTSLEAEVRTLGDAVEVRVASVTVTGLVSEWSSEVTGDASASDAIPAPSNLRVDAGVSSLTVRWDRLDRSDVSRTRVYWSQTSNFADAVLLSEKGGNESIFTGLASNITRYFWAEHVVHGFPERVGARSGPVTGVTLGVQNANVAEDAIATPNLQLNSASNSSVLSAQTAQTYLDNQNFGQIAINTVAGSQVIVNWYAEIISWTGGIGELSIECRKNGVFQQRLNFARGSSMSFVDTSGLSGLRTYTFTFRTTGGGQTITMGRRMMYAFERRR